MLESLSNSRIEMAIWKIDANAAVIKCISTNQNDYPHCALKRVQWWGSRAVM